MPRSPHCGREEISCVHAALELYPAVFEDACALDRLGRFASFNGADFYDLVRNRHKVARNKTPWRWPHEIAVGTQSVVLLRAGKMVAWQLGF